jgi:hypothetical protein
MNAKQTLLTIAVTSTLILGAHGQAVDPFQKKLELPSLEELAARNREADLEAKEADLKAKEADLEAKAAALKAKAAAFEDREIAIESAERAEALSRASASLRKIIEREEQKAERPALQSPIVVYDRFGDVAITSGGPAIILDARPSASIFDKSLISE